MSGRLDSNQRPPEPHSESTPTDLQAEPLVTPTPSDACTTACTCNQETTKATDLDALAAELLALPKEERARLAGPFGTSYPSTGFSRISSNSVRHYPSFLLEKMPCRTANLRYVHFCRRNRRRLTSRSSRAWALKLPRPDGDQ
jgi:hypothetical protein